MIMVTEKDAREDLRAVLETSPKQATGLLAAIEEGRIEGASYYGTCACLIGTLAGLKRPLSEEASQDVNERRDWLTAVRAPDMYTPAESWFWEIATGDTPKTNTYSAKAALWVQEWLIEKGLVK